MYEYSSADIPMTLSEAIQQLRLSEAGNDATERMSGETAKAFEQHDAVHVVFGCGTSIRDEIAVHVWMLFATTANISEMHHAVASRAHRNVLNGIGHFKLASVWIGSLPRVLSIVFKSLRMKKRLAVKDLSKLKEQSILEIRQEYGIVL